MSVFIDTPLEFLKGVGSIRAQMLQRELGLVTFGDLLEHFPYRYVDKRFYTPIGAINNDQAPIAICGRVISKEIVNKRLVVRFGDQSGSTELIWFKGIKWVSERLTIGQAYVCYGKPSLFRQTYNFTHPEIDPHNESAEDRTEGLIPMYNTSESMKSRGLTSKALCKLTRELIQHPQFFIPEILPADLILRLGLISRREAFICLHYPSSLEALERARKRYKFEELFLLQMRILRDKWQLAKVPGPVFSKVGTLFNGFYEQLPFSLTGAQQRVMKEIRRDLATGVRMNRLLQGDVGSGKTLVAFMAMLLASDNGYQACMMAPTEILARQHFESCQTFLGHLPLRIAFLSGSTRSKARRELLDDLSQGRINWLIGTHALIEEPVVFKNLGLSVIDEQHRFGVEQRAKLQSKANPAPHVLVMTATPIPRTLAMSLYGDLDVSIIDELPPNRKPIKTLLRDEHSRGALWNFVQEELNKGRQAYIVYPMIYESEKSDLKDLSEGYMQVTDRFPAPTHRVSLVHGKLPNDEKQLGMEMFVQGRTQIMVATTVIEVGVNVPNASIMVIENAERFGLSQLHQLRGRVGRGAEQSYCILMSKEKLSAEARERLQTMVRTCDGFEIAEADLRLRGPGDIQGIQQSGLLNFKLANIATDEILMRLARQAVIEILERDPFLQDPSLALLVKHKALRKPSWGKIA